jgi:hypothetical protein
MSSVIFDQQDDPNTVQKTLDCKVRYKGRHPSVVRWKRQAECASGKNAEHRRNQDGINDDYQGLLLEGPRLACRRFGVKSKACLGTYYVKQEESLAAGLIEHAHTASPQTNKNWMPNTRKW